MANRFPPAPAAAASSSGLQADGRPDKALCWGRCHRAAAYTLWLGATDGAAPSPLLCFPFPSLLSVLGRLGAEAGRLQSLRQL